MIKWDENLQMFIRILHQYGAIRGYRFFPNAVNIDFRGSKDSIEIIFDRGGEGIYQLKKNIVTSYTYKQEEIEQDMIEEE